MTSDRVLAQMRAALLMCTATVACTRGERLAADGVGAGDGASNDASGSGNVTDAASADAAPPGDASNDAGVTDAGDTGDGATNPAPYGTVACPIHPGGHPKLADGGVSPVGLGGLGGLNGIRSGVGGDGCPACGMGGPRYRDVGDVAFGPESFSAPVPNGEHVLASLRSRVRACYNQGLQMDPSIGGTLHMSVQLAPTGAVVTVEASSNSGLPDQVAKCTSRVLKSATFEPTPSGSTLALQVRFVKQ